MKKLHIVTAVALTLAMSNSARSEPITDKMVENALALNIYNERCGPCRRKPSLWWT